MQRNVRANLGCNFVIGNVRFDAQRPNDVQLVFVQLQQEHDQHEQCVEHEERKHGLVTQFFQVDGDSRLFFCLFVVWCVGGMLLVAVLGCRSRGCRINCSDGGQCVVHRRTVRRC